MKWLTIIIVAAIIAGILGALNSKDGEKGEGFFSGALAGGMGCGYVIFEIIFSRRWIDTFILNSSAFYLDKTTTTISCYEKRNI